MSKEISEKLDKVLAFMGLKSEEKKPVAKAMIVADSNGVSLSITKADGSEIEGMPVAGDMVTVDGAPGEGSYILPDMKITIEAKAGVISAVTEVTEEAPAEAATPEPNPELEQAKADLAASQQKVFELQAKVEENESFKKETEAKFALIEKSLKATNSKYIPQGRTTEFRKDEEKTSTSISKEDLRKRKDSYKKTK